MDQPATVQPAPAPKAPASGPCKAVALAMVEGHRQARMMWQASGRSDAEWQARLFQLQARADAIPEPDYP